MKEIILASHFILYLTFSFFIFLLSLSYISLPLSTFIHSHYPYSTFFCSFTTSSLFYLSYCTIYTHTHMHTLSLILLFLYSSFPPIFSYSFSQLFPHVTSSLSLPSSLRSFLPTSFLSFSFSQLKILIFNNDKYRIKSPIQPHSWGLQLS